MREHCRCGTKLIRATVWTDKNAKGKRQLVSGWLCPAGCNLIKTLGGYYKVGSIFIDSLFGSPASQKEG